MELHWDLQVSQLIQMTPGKIEVRSRYSLFRPRTRHRRAEREMLLLPRGPFNSNLPTSNHAERKREGSNVARTKRGEQESLTYFLNWVRVGVGTHIHTVVNMSCQMFQPVLCKVWCISPWKVVWFSHNMYCLSDYQCLCKHLPKLIKQLKFYSMLSCLMNVD